MKVALCCIVKDENKYLVEYVEHYKSIGFSHIYIYDYNDKNGEHPEEVLQKYIDEGFVTIIDVREVDRPQLAVYQHCYNNYNKDYNWMCFFDADEFLEIRNSNFNDINELLSQDIYNNYNAIVVNWELYGDNEQLYYNDKPVKERFKKIANNNQIKGNIIKIILKCNIDVNIIWDYRIPFSNPHHPYQYLVSTNKEENKKNVLLFPCDSLGNVRNPWAYNINECMGEQTLILKHYMTKSTEEWVLRKLTFTPDFISKLETLNWELFLEEYFAMNKFTMEKFRLIQKMVNEKYGYNRI